MTVKGGKIIYTHFIFLYLQHIWRYYPPQLELRVKKKEALNSSGTYHHLGTHFSTLCMYIRFSKICFFLKFILKEEKVWENLGYWHYYTLRKKSDLCLMKGLSQSSSTFAILLKYKSLHSNTWFLWHKYVKFWGAFARSFH